MYNSLVVALIMHVVRAVQSIYRKSFIRKIMFVLKTHIRRWIKGSVVLQILNRDGVIFKNSIVYGIIAKLFSLFDSLMRALHRFNIKLTEGSRVSEGLGDYSKDISSGLRFVYELLFFTGIVFLVMGFTGFSNVSPVISAVLIIMGVIGYLIKGYEIVSIENSVAANFVLDLFRLDKEGENWW